MASRRLPASLLAALLIAAIPAGAGCGLSFCPRPEEPGARSLELGFMAKQTAFDIQGTEGGYTELMATVQYTAFGKVALGLHAPFLVLDAGNTEAGFGNLIAYAEYRARPAWLSAFGAGVQLEIPMPHASEHGLGDDHFMAVPYVSFAKPGGRLMLGGALGAGISLSGGGSGEHHHHATGAVPVYVHPHENYEFLYRASAGMRLSRGRFLPEAFLDGQSVLGHTEVEGSDMHFLAAGLSLPLVLGNLTLAPNASLPLLSGERYSWSAGITAGWKLGLGGPARPAPGET